MPKGLPTYRRPIDTVAREFIRKYKDPQLQASHRADRADMNCNAAAAYFYEDLMGRIATIQSERPIAAAEGR